MHKTQEYYGNIKIFYVLHTVRNVKSASKNDAHLNCLTSISFSSVVISIFLETLGTLSLMVLHHLFDNFLTQMLLSLQEAIRLSFFSEPDGPVMGNGSFKSSILVPGYIFSLICLLFVV